MKKVLVGMSGGIDSSVSAYLLKNLGYEVEGVTMKLFKEGQALAPNITKDACFSPNEVHDIEKSKEICEKIGIKHHVLDLSSVYESYVLKNFRDEYMNARTPNPCVICNQKIKFGALMDYARESGIEFDYFATGHYAEIVYAFSRYAIKRAKDLLKDQSYFLYRLSQEQLSHILFPLASFTKKEVRTIDVNMGFHSANQEESMDFYSGDYNELLKAGERAGNIVDTNGRVLGEHKGFWNYTIGQRKGLGIGYKEPLYVIALDSVKNEVVVGTKLARYLKRIRRHLLNLI